VFLLYGATNALTNPVATLVTGKVAGQQFENNDVSYLTSSYIMHFFAPLGIPFFILIIVLAAIWWAPGKSGIAKLKGIFAAGSTSAIVAVLVLLSPQPAKAYYDQSDYSEWRFILPNQSAIFVPDVGANKESQAQFGSEAYLRENKVPAKRFQIPHAKLQGSSAWSNFYVPTGRLIIVDRTPYAREWTKDGHRGTSKADQSFPCQSQEGLNVTVEITIAASVTEDQAPRFLYYFGVKNPDGDPTDPKVIFTSVYYSRTLSDVMDTVVRGKIQSLVCKEISSRQLTVVNAEANKIMEAAEKNVTQFMESRGITLDYIGWGGTFTFDDVVQKAINDRYAAETITPVLSILQAQADIKIKEGLGNGLVTHGLPQNLIAIPENMMNLTSMFAKSAIQQTK
jgi:hypothetical protein